MIQASPISNEQLDRARAFVERMEAVVHEHVRAVEDGRFVRAVRSGSFPLDGIRFVHTNHYHLIRNDIGNLNLYVTKARDQQEMLFFHAMAVEEKNHLASLFLLTDALGLERDDVRRSVPHHRCLVRTNFFSRLAHYGTAGQIALTIRLNFPVWAAGAKGEAVGLREHYALGKQIPGTDTHDLDILERFAEATAGYDEAALAAIGRDLTDERSEAHLEEIARWAIGYEALVWEAYYEEGLASSERGSQP